MTEKEAQLAVANELLKRVHAEWISNVDEFDDPVTQELGYDINTYLSMYDKSELDKKGIINQQNMSKFKRYSLLTGLDCHMIHTT